MKNNLNLRICFAAYFILSYGLSSFNAQSPPFQWAKNVGGASEDRGYAIAVDGSGNVYTTGTFSETADFDPGAGTFNLTSLGALDLFISKLDANGNFVWAKRVGGISNDGSTSIAIDASGNVYTTGSFAGTVDFDPGAGTSNLSSGSTTYPNMFVLKLDPAGNFLLAKSMGGSAGVGANAITLDASGNIYTTGYLIGVADFDPDTGTFNLTSVIFPDIFISKLDASGKFVWAKSMGGSSFDYGSSIALDASGNVYTTGSFNGIVDFNPGPGTFNLTSAGQYDIFILKLDASGNFIMAGKMGGASNDAGTSIAVDGAGNILTTGAFFSTGDFDPGTGTYNLTSGGQQDMFISKLNVSGNFLWAKRIGGPSDDVGNSIALDALGNIYTTGTFSGTADFDGGPGTSDLISAGDNDIFILKSDPSGNYGWVKQLGGADDDSGFSIAVDASGSIFTTGYFKATVDFDPDIQVANLSCAGDKDCFIHKMGTAPVGIPKLSNSTKVKIYPNPTDGELTITLQNISDFISINILDATGLLVIEKKSEDRRNIVIDLSDQPNGIYFVEIIQNETVTRYKSIKH